MTTNATAERRAVRRYRHDMTGFVDFLHDWMPRYSLGEVGQYTRHLGKSGYDSSRSDAYAVTGMANIRYMLAEFPTDPDERQAWVDSLQSFQDPETGVFLDQTHSDYHTTAHTIAALELFEARPLHPLHFLEPLRTTEALHEFLDSQDWSWPWGTSHNPAGAASAVAITEMFGADWLADWCDWLDREVDPTTGLWRNGMMLSTRDNPGFFANLGGAFHYHFVYEHLRQPWPYPERVIDSALTMLYDSATPFALQSVSFKEIDLVFCLNRARRQTPYRFDDVTAALSEMADRVATLLSDPGHLASPQLDDVHQTFGAVCAVAELQRALPGVIHTPRPLRLVLDRRPFI